MTALDITNPELQHIIDVDIDVLQVFRVSIGIASMYHGQASIIPAAPGSVPGAVLRSGKRKPGGGPTESGSRGARGAMP